MNKKGKHTFQIIIVVLIFIIAVGMGAFFALRKKPVVTVSGESSTQKEQETNVNSVNFDGKEYKFNPAIKTILFLGVDTREKVENEFGAGKNGQADCIIVILMNTDSREISLLEISRETMTDIDLYTQEGKYYATENAQLALQYAYGDGNAKSSWLMKKAVSSILNGVPINYSLALNIDGIVKLTDAIGGVEITVPKDYTYIDPAFVKGATITLNGDQAERYVRYRDISVSGSNMDRMERQNQFIPAMMAKVKSKAEGNDKIYSKLLEVADNYITTDLSSEDLSTFSSYAMSDKIEILPGEVKAGEKHDEYWLDETGVQKLVMDLFYIQN